MGQQRCVCGKAMGGKVKGNVKVFTGMVGRAWGIVSLSKYCIAWCVVVVGSKVRDMCGRRGQEGRAGPLSPPPLPQGKEGKIK